MVAIIIIGIISAIVIANSGQKKPVKVSYKDTIVSKNLYTNIKIDMASKKVYRDNVETTLQQEFEINDTKANLILSSTEELTNFFADSTINVEMNNGIAKLTNPYQTKTLFVEAENLADNFNADALQLQNGIYMLKYDSQKRTKAAYEFLKNQVEVKNVYLDEVMQIEQINDEEQTLYKDEKTYDYGVSAMGLDNFKKIINENGNPAQVVIATIGYGAIISDKYFDNKIAQNAYDFISESDTIKETNPQGSRILEVIKESTTDNVKILPLVVVNGENYTTVSSIAQALVFAIENSDVICYEIVHNQNSFIELLLDNAFNKNIPVCCVTKPANEGAKVFPADYKKTIAVSSVDKSLKTRSFSATGDYIDFVASSTDLKEILNESSSVSRWAGAGYSNAHIASIIALIKTYHKDYTIEQIYKFIINFCEDLGNKGKDIIYGYGFPNFSKLKIADLDTETPKVPELQYDNEKWEKSKIIQIKSQDNIRIYGWNITKSKDTPKEWEKLDKKTNVLDVKKELKENATYYVWVADTAGRVSYISAEINKIDNKPPTVQYGIDDSRIETEKIVTITVTATDDLSGLHQMPYSWDKQNWGTNNRILNAFSNGEYKVYVRDALDNITEKTIKIKQFPEVGTSEIDDGEIIKEIKVSSNWSNNKNKEVIITFNDNLNVEMWKVADTTDTPFGFEATGTEIETDFEGDEDINNTNTSTNSNNDSSQQGRTNMTITIQAEAEKKYYLWIKDTQGNVKSQGFKIKKPN